MLDIRNFLLLVNFYAADGGDTWRKSESKVS